MPTKAYLRSIKKVQRRALQNHVKKLYGDPDFNMEILLLKFENIEQVALINKTVERLRNERF